MTGLNFASLIRYYTQTNSSTLPDSDIVLLANAVKDNDFAPAITEVNEDLFGVLSTRDLVASDSSDVTKREYSLPEDIIKMKYVEALLDGSTWLPLTELDLNVYKRSTDETTIIENFANEDKRAFYDLFRGSLWIYSGTLTAVTAGLKLWYIAFPADIDASTLALSTDISIDPTTTTSQIPRMFHELWARKISIMYKQSRQKPIALNEHELAFDMDFQKKLDSQSQFNLDRAVVSPMPNDHRLQGIQTWDDTSPHD